MAAETIEGRIMKGIGGFYYIKSSDKIYECRARGRFRKDGITPLVGDIVRCNIDTAAGSGMIIEILPRKNALIRPPVANVTSIAVVFSVKNPRPNLRTVDKLITSAMYVGIKPLICINKTDLMPGDEYYEIYSGAGFDTIMLSAETGENIEILKKKLSGEITVFAGNSGVGKSSLLNCILDEQRLATGEVSDKVERGRHTTRHSELIPISSGRDETEEGYIIDTPGFSSFSVSDIDENELWRLFPEFLPYAEKCRFLDCTHTVEDGCAVIESVKRGKISNERHESYVAQYHELLDAKKY